MLRDLLARLFPAGGPARKPAPGPPQPLAPDRAAVQTEGYARHSHGLEQFLGHLQSQQPLCVLDVGGVNQANVEFLTGLGHKLFSEELLRALDAAPAPDWSGDSDDAAVREFADSFLRQSLEFPAESLDGVLLWDSLEFLPPPLLKATVDRLYYVTRPGACMLAFFHAEEKAAEVPTYRYRIHDPKTLLLVQRSMRRPCHLLNNRSVEKLFRRFRSVKFFLARDHLREVIVRR